MWQHQYLFLSSKRETEKSTELQRERQRERERERERERVAVSEKMYQIINFMIMRQSLNFHRSSSSDRKTDRSLSTENHFWDHYYKGTNWSHEAEWNIEVVLSSN